jgi:itaconate CoA-transferase
MIKLLEDVLVVSIEQAVAAPFATRHLADLGARVIKIERPPGGDFARAYDATVNGMASHFVWLNRSKQSLTLDFKRAEATPVVDELMSRADVFVQNLAPGAAERVGLGGDDLRARYPSLIVCEISGYGPTGPYQDKKAYDLLIQSEAGLLSITGTPDTPSKAGISIADIAAGMYAYSGILAALLRRAQTGEGSLLHVSMLEALGEWMGYPAYFTGYSGTAPSRTGSKHAAIAPYGPFRSADGATIYLAVQNEREWLQFCVLVLGRPELADDERFCSNSNRVQNTESLDREIERTFATVDSRQLRTRLDRAKIAYARLNNVKDFLSHPQLEARGRWRMVDSPVGPLRALLPPAIPEGLDVTMDAIPDVGQHTNEVLVELGIETATIERWRASGVI